MEQPIIRPSAVEEAENAINRTTQAAKAMVLIAHPFPSLTASAILLRNDPPKILLCQEHSEELYGHGLHDVLTKTVCHGARARMDGVGARNVRPRKAGI